MYKGKRLSDVKWEGGENFEDLATFGTHPARNLLDILEDIIDDDDSDKYDKSAIINEIGCKLEDIEATIYRFIDEMEEEEKAPETAPESTETGAKGE